MATWLFEVDLGSGYQNITTLVRPELAKRRLEIHKELRPTINDLTFTVAGDQALVAALMAGDRDTPIRVTKDGARWFTGFVTRTPETTTRARLGDMVVKAYDPGILLKRKLRTDYKKLNGTVSQVVGELLTAAGWATQALGTIAKTVDATWRKGSITYWDAIEKLLLDFGYVLYFDEHGTARTFLLAPASLASTKTYSTGLSGNITDELAPARKQRRYGGARVTYYRREAKTNAVVFSDQTNAGQLNKCNIDLTQYSGVYPPRSGTEEVYCEYALEEDGRALELIATDGVTFAIQGTGGVTVAQAVDYGLKAAIKVTGSGIITRLDVLAATAIVKAGKVIKESLISGLTEEVEDYEATFITAEADADFLVSARRQYWENSGVTYRFGTWDAVTLGAVVTIADSHLGINLIALVVGYDEDDEGRRSVWAEALEPYALQSRTTEGNAGTRPNPPGGVPVVVLADTTPPTIPGTPSVSQISTGALRVTFVGSSDAESGVAYYNLYRRKQGAASWAAVLSDAHDGSASYILDDTSTIVGEAYEYAASAVDRRGNESALSAWSTATTAVVTDAPANVSGTPTARAYLTRMQVDWAAVAGAVAYRVERSINSGGSWSALTDVSANRLDDPIAAGVEAATLAAYRYRVKALSIYQALSASWATSGAPTTTDYGTYVPAAPTVSFAVAKRSLSATWLPQANLLNADGWDVQISRDNSNWYAPNLAAKADADAWGAGALNGMLKLGSPSLQLNYLPITLDANSLPQAAGQAYYLRVRARCSSPATQSAWTTSAALTVLPLLGIDLATAQVTQALIAAGAVDMTKFASGIRPPRVVAALPANPYTGYALGDLVSLTTDGKLYRMTNMSGAGTTGWSAAVAAGDIAGQIAASQIAALEASKITGQLTDAQIAALAAAKITGTIGSTQIAAGAITTPKIAAGAVTATELAALAVVAGKIAAGAVTATELAAGAVIAGKIAAGAIQAVDIAAGAITTAKLAAGAVTANEIAANAVTAAKILAGAVGADQVAAGAITTDKMVVKTRAKNINVDPNIEDASQWTTSGVGTLSIIDDTTGPVGNKVLSPGAFQAYVCDKNYYPLDTSKRYRVRFWAKRSSDANGVLYFCLRQYSSPGTPCATNGGRNPYKPSCVIPPTTWTEYSFEWSASDWQSGARFVMLDWLLNYSGTAGKMYVQGARFEEMVSGELVVDGTITAAKLLVSALSAITANLGEITAGKLKSYDWVEGVSGMIVDLDAGEVRRGDKAWAIPSSGVPYFRDVRFYGIDYEEIDCGDCPANPSTTLPDDPYGDSGELDCGDHDGTLFADRVIDCGTAGGDD